MKVTAMNAAAMPTNVMTPINVILSAAKNLLCRVAKARSFASLRMTAVAAATALAGCGSIGDGSTIESIQLQISTTGSSTGPFTVSRCLRDQLVAIATFSNGTRSDFSFRATWTSSDPAIVQVSNNDVPAVLVDDGAFKDSTFSNFRPGTVIPKGAAGQTATITASFLGLSSSMEVEIATPTFHIAPVSPGVNPYEPPISYLGPGTTRRFTFLAETPDGRTQTMASLNALGNLNPVLWRFVGGMVDPANPDVAGDVDESAVPTAEAPDAVINQGGIVTAKATSLTPVYEVQAITSLCDGDDDDAFRPTAQVQVAPFGTGPEGTRLTLSYEKDFNGPGVEPNGDLIAGTFQILQVLGHLDTDGDTVGDVTQNLLGQVDMNVTHTTTCTAGTTNCTCEADGVTCTKRLVIANGNQVQTLISNDSANATLYACFNDIDTTHNDDCEEAALPEGNAQLSNEIGIQAIAAKLTATDASTVILPATPEPQPAFTYPGRQFEVFGTFTALAEGTMPFAAGTSETAVQKITRHGLWTVRPAGSTTSVSPLGFVRNLDDGFFGPGGSFGYLKDVTENTDVDLYFDTGGVLTALPEPAPVTFTICPSSGC